MSTTPPHTIFDLYEPIIGNPNPLFVNLFHAGIAIFALIVIICICSLLSNTISAPSAPVGTKVPKRDYEALQVTRQPITDVSGYDPSGPMIQYQVATANFGGIYTEDPGLLNPWSGTANPDAARLQVEAGARALTLDIWPDPADSSKPVVCSMMDLTKNGVQSSWLGGGLNRGVSRYSNWNMITRKAAPVGEVIQAAIKAAFSSTVTNQNADPFFLILKLHGAMTIDYLNRLGDIVNAQVHDNGYAMNSVYNACNNQSKMCSAPVNDFINGKAFIIVIPDINPGYNSLPSINTYSGFKDAFLKTKLGEATNYLEQNPNTVFFEPEGIATISLANQPNCIQGGTQQSLAQVGFCVIQPSIGSSVTDNDSLFSTSYTNCLQSGAQFIAVNLFSSKKNDGVLNTFFDPKYFGVHSFRQR